MNSDAQMAKLADALDPKFRNHRFYLVTCDEMPFTIFIGKFGACWSVELIIEGWPNETRK
jgi:hypothetical protein